MHATRIRELLINYRQQRPGLIYIKSFLQFSVENIEEISIKGLHAGPLFFDTGEWQ